MYHSGFEIPPQNCGCNAQLRHNRRNTNGTLRYSVRSDQGAFDPKHIREVRRRARMYCEALSGTLKQDM